MGRNGDDGSTSLISTLTNLLRRCLFGVLSAGPIPNHIAFIMDGNRRYAKKHNLIEGEGHRLGFSSLMSMLKYCYELGVKYITIYAFSIDNFKRRPEEVQSLMDLIKEKIDGLVKEESLVNQYGVRVHFVGDLTLLNDSVRLAAEKAMEATSRNSKAVLSICIAYTSSNEITNAVRKSCEEKWGDRRNSVSSQGLNGSYPDRKLVRLVDIEKNMLMAVAPDPDILIRTSGETRLSNFLLWQSGHCLLYSPSALWPEIGVWHLVWALVMFQRNYSYFEKKKKQL